MTLSVPVGLPQAPPLPTLVTVYPLVVHVVIASVLLMAVIYVPLAASATFAMITGHWPTLQLC
ncbi:hypothetical protein LJR016_005224 [Devosia sp. LjRoot16]|uniref:hypothetical protein n=1 Tax=Devosia sp. LjRoot16 TaxID=3342271 RepID=UPI003ECF4184